MTYFWPIIKKITGWVSVFLFSSEETARLISFSGTAPINHFISEVPAFHFQQGTSCSVWWEKKVVTLSHSGCLSFHRFSTNQWHSLNIPAFTPCRHRLWIAGRFACLFQHHSKGTIWRGPYLIKLKNSWSNFRVEGALHALMNTYCGTSSKNVFSCAFIIQMQFQIRFRSPIWP